MHGFLVGISSGLKYGLQVGLAAGLLIGIPCFFEGGGSKCVSHIVLRILLWISRSTPWNYPRFLDYAADRILLRKVGGGYIFIHRLLLEYFASLDTETKSSETAKQA